MKILLIPSWYPTLDNPLKGSFFHEQAQFLHGKEGIEIKVLYGNKRSYSLWKWICVWIDSFFNNSLLLSKKNILQDPESFAFDLPANRRIPDFLQLGLEIRVFQKAFDSFSKLGWIPELIHSQSGMDSSIYSHHINKITGIPFSIIEHQVFVFHYYSKLRSTLIMDAFKAAYKTAAVSNDERKQVMMNQPACNPEVIWNLVKEDRFSIKLQKRNGVFTVLTILNSLPIKGGEVFLRSMALVLQRDPGVRFIIIGKGSDAKSPHSSDNLFVKLSRDLGIMEMGEFLPFVPREVISDVINRAHVFVSPSIQEPHGIAVREAMMCGLPIISSANGGVEDSIYPETGIIVPIRNCESMAEAILAVKGNLKIYNPEVIRKVAISQCGTDVFLNKMVEFYSIA